MWLFLSLGTAFFAGSSDALSKHLVKKYRVNVVAFIKAFWGSVFFAAVYLDRKKADAAKKLLDVGGLRAAFRSRCVSFIPAGASGVAAFLDHSFHGIYARLSFGYGLAFFKGNGNGRRSARYRKRHGRVVLNHIAFA
jgi:hypothetical protein